MVLGCKRAGNIQIGLIQQNAYFAVFCTRVLFLLITREEKRGLCNVMCKIRRLEERGEEGGECEKPLTGDKCNLQKNAVFPFNVRDSYAEMSFYVLVVWIAVSGVLQAFYLSF